MEKSFGAIPPMVTPFKEDGQLDEKNLQKIVEFLCAHVHGLFICGSYGNGPLMNLEERKTVAEIVAKYRKEHIQFIVHVGTTNVKDSVELAKHAESIGAVKVAAVAPYYYHHTKDNLRRFYERLANAVNIPVYVYYNPKFSGYGMDVDFLDELADLGIAGVKDSSFDIMYHADCIRKIKKEGFDVVLGTEAMFLSAASLGTRAFIPGLGNAWPELCVELFEAAIQDRMEEARKLQAKVNSVRDIMYLAKSTVVAVYTMLELRGICKVYPREPFIPLPDKEKDLIRVELQKVGLLQQEGR